MLAISVVLLTSAWPLALLTYRRNVMALQLQYHGRDYGI